MPDFIKLLFLTDIGRILLSCGLMVFGGLFYMITDWPYIFYTGVFGLAATWLYMSIWFLINWISGWRK